MQATFSFMVFALVFPFASAGSLLGVEFDVPQKVIDGWHQLAFESKTYSLIQEAEGLPANMKPASQIISRLDGVYAKLEEIARESTGNDRENSIINVMLFDGNEYFAVGRDSISARFAVKAIGAKNSPLFGILETKREISTRIFDLDLVLSLNSDELEAIRYEEKSDNECYVTVTRNTNPAQKPPVIVAKLDPVNRYRVVEAIGELGPGANYRLFEEMHYDVHPAIPSRLVKYHQQKSLDGSWELMPGTQKVTWSRMFLQTDGLSPDAFTIEHYGLPPFKSRKSNLIAIIGTIAIGIGLIGFGFWKWRRSRGG